MMPCSRTSLQPPRPTPPSRLDQQGRSGRTPLPAHLQLGLESTHEYKGTPQDLRDYIYKDHAMAQVKALRLSNYCISISSLYYHLSELINLAQPQTLLVD